MDSLPRVVEDIHGVLRVFSDGSILRENDICFNIPIHDDGSVVWKDYIFHEKNNLRLRLYKPLMPSSSPSTQTSLPVVYFLHGGGFCVGSFTWPNNHNACLRLASGLQALVVAPDYRLAPEHRLPAATEDALSSLKWLQNQATGFGTWLHDGVDFNRIYIVGDSSGGNIAHHLAVQLGPGSPELAPVRVRGYVLMAPFFGGTVRTKSEAEVNIEPLLTLEDLNRFWRLSLPLGKDADHPLANPVGPFSQSLEPVKFDPMLVIAGSCELMRDRVESYARKLQDLGKKVRYVEFEGEHHGFFINDPYSKPGDRVLQEIKDFMSKLSG